MYMLRQRIVKESDLDDNTTWRYKLPSVGKYTAIEMVIDTQRGNTRTLNTVCKTIEDCISKVELLAGGSRALFSLPGTQLDAMNYWAFKRPNPRRYRQEDVTGNKSHLFLLGGRDLYDREFGFDFARLPETYLEYTYDLGENDTDYFEADQHNVTLYGWRWMGPGEPSFIGYLRSRQLAAWATTGTDTIKTIELPVGHPYRFIGVQAKTRARTISATTKYIELKVNNGEFSPVNILSPMDWCMQEVAEYGLDNEIGGLEYLVASTEMDIPYWFSYYQNVLAQRYGASGQPVINHHFITVPARIQATSAVAGEVSFRAKGWGFQKCLRIGFDHDYDGADLLDTSGMGALDLEITEHTSGRDAAVFAQDIVPY